MLRENRVPYKNGVVVCKRWKSFCSLVITELEAASITASDLVIRKRTSIKCNVNSVRI